jgi:C4-dicarboxylate-specific signal transduction histidine kinase
MLPASPNRLVRHWHQLERLLKERIARSLSLFAVPSKEDVLTLTRRIDKLGQIVNTSQRALTQKLKDRTVELEQNSATLQETRSRLDKANTLATLASVIPALVHDMSAPVGNSNLAAATLHAGLEHFRVKLAACRTFKP